MRIAPQIAENNWAPGRVIWEWVSMEVVLHATPSSDAPTWMA
jgi:hypothetical protein